MSLTAASLRAAMPGCSEKHSNLYLPHIVESMLIAGCTNQLRASMFLAQCGSETCSLASVTEYASGWEYDRSQNYDLAMQLGNTQPGDGPRFKGRGIIQCTGRGNTTKFSSWCWHRGIVETHYALVFHPERIADDPRLAALTAAWYWGEDHPRDGYENLNEAADDGNVLAATHMINGGEWNLSDRRLRFTHCRGLGDAIIPSTDSGQILKGVI